MLKVYDFECPKCGKVKEYIIEKNDPPTCNKCGVKMERLIAAPPFHLKGSGWSKDNYGLKNDKDKNR